MITTSFTQVAEGYAEYRPGYPDTLNDHLIELCPPDIDRLAVEAGCVTGNVTRWLNETYAQAIRADL